MISIRENSGMNKVCFKDTFNGSSDVFDVVDIEVDETLARIAYLIDGMEKSYLVDVDSLEKSMNDDVLVDDCIIDGCYYAKTMRLFK